MNSSEIFTGNLYSPDTVSIPTIQNPLRPDQPIVYARGQSFSVFVKYPQKTKKLLFTISKRVYSASGTVFQQIVFPRVEEAGVAEFFVGGETTLSMSEDLYYWDVFQLRDDGTRDIWAPYNTGTFSIVDSPSSNSLHLETPSSNDIYNSQTNNSRVLNLAITRGNPWDLSIRWIAGGVTTNLDGYGALMRIIESTSTNEVVVELSSDNGKIVLNSATDIITASLTAPETSAIALGSYPYYLDVWETNVCDKITLISGNVVVQDPT